MIFNFGFDKSVELILTCDKKNRLELAKLIYNIPDDLLNKIVCKLQSNDDKFSKFSRAFRDENENTYFYDIDVCSSVINIKLSVWKNDYSKVEEVTEFKLFSVFADLTNIDLDETDVIGSYNYRNSRVFNGMVVAFGEGYDYQIVKDTPYGLVIRFSNNKYGIVKLLNFDIEKDDLKDKCSIDRLVRRKNR